MNTAMQNVKSTSKILIKAFIIGFIILILQIPTFFITNLIEEREDRQKEAIEEVSSKWAGKQNIYGPVVVIPYWQYSADTSKNLRVKEYAYFLPDNLEVDAKATPEERYRGIYKVILYSAQMSLKGGFTEVLPEKLNLPQENILWNETFIQFNVTDPKGLQDELKLNWNGKILNLTMQSFGDNEGMSALLDVTGPEDLKNIQFSANINLGGSQQLLFTPIGKTTSVRLNSTWPHPSFTGDILPQTKAVQDSGFTAEWKSLSFKRNFPQQWNGSPVIPIRNTHTDRVVNMPGLSSDNAAFGTNFFVPVNAYQKTLRSIKYSLLCILLTFAFFFLIENSNKKSVHPFQYGLIGIALVLFYTLLLSFSEYTGFNIAYGIASVATIALIGWFVKGVLASSRLATIMSVVLVLTYGYVFTILQLQDYALLMGSIGLFITLGVIMYFSRKIQW